MDSFATNTRCGERQRGDFEMLRLRFLIVLFLVIFLVGCGDDPNPVVSKDSDPQVKIETPKEIIGPDGAPMVLIPAGEFQMGSNDGVADEKPVHTVYVDAFYMDKYEVTNAQYKKFVKTTAHNEPEGCIYANNDWAEGKPWLDKNYNSDNQPVACVSWEDAKAYADWVGKRP